MIISDFLERCAEIESIVGEIYTIFMEQQSESLQLSSLWNKTANEEHNHVQQFLLAKRLSSSTQVKPEIFSKDLQKIFENISTLKVRIASSPVTPEESIRLAISIEEKLEEFHLNNVKIFSEESLNMLFKSMMNNDKGHVETLKRALITLQKP